MATTVVTLELPQPGYSALAQRVVRPLASAQVFNPLLLVGLDAAGKATPFLTGTVAGIQYALGLLDPATYSSSFTSGASFTSPVLDGVFSMANGTAGNALVQASVGLAVYTADGLTGNLTSAANPKIGGGTTTGKLVGTFLGLDPAISGNVLVSCIPEVNAAIVANGGVLPVPVADGGTGSGTAAGARTNLAAAQSGVATASTGPTALSTQPTISAPTFTPTYAAIVPISGVPGSWGGTGSAVLTTTAIAALDNVAANSLAGGTISDGTVVGLIISNTAFNGSGVGTLTVRYDASNPYPAPFGVPTGLTNLTITPPAAHPGTNSAPVATAGASAAHTHLQS